MAQSMKSTLASIFLIGYRFSDLVYTAKSNRQVGRAHRGNRANLYGVELCPVKMRC